MEIPETAWLVPVRCQGTAAKFTLGPHTSPLTVFSVAVKRADKQRKSNPCQKAHGSLSISINCILQSGHWDKGLSKGGTRRGESTSGVHLTYWALTMAKDCGKKITNSAVVWTHLPDSCWNWTAVATAFRGELVTRAVSFWMHHRHYWEWVS